jgi:hypothetical protein
VVLVLVQARHIHTTPRKKRVRATGDDDDDDDDGRRATGDGGVL